MLKFLTNLSIFRRLFLAAMLSAIIPGIVIFVLGSSYVNTLNTINDTVRMSSNAVKLATDQQANLLRMNALISALNTTSPNSASATQQSREIRQLTDDFDQKLSLYQRNYQIVTSDGMKGVRNVLNGNGLGNQIPVSQQSMIFVVNLQWNAYKTAQNAVLNDLQKRGGANQIAADQAQSNLLYLPLKGNLDNLVGLTEGLNQAVAQVNAAQITPTILWTIVAFLFSTLVVFLIGYIVNLTITSPLRQLAFLTRRIAQGDTGARANMVGNDEIYLVASSMNTMLDHIVRLAQEAHFQHNILQTRVEQLIKEVSGIGEGDLRAQARVTSDALGILARSFNYMISELGSLVVRVKIVANEVEQLTTTTLGRMTQLVELANQQIQQIGGATVEVEKMANITRAVASRAHTLYTIALESHQTANTGREAVQQVIEDMGHIHMNVQSTAGKVKLLGESSREINDIVEVITNVAYQTNRLALDAAVQAAMAGDNGKGFSAVASDIRRLAEQTKNQAGRINSIVRTVNENIDNAGSAMHDTERETAEGTRHAQQAGAALGSIFEAVERQAQEIESINDMATQQLKSSSAVAQIMHRVSQDTQESSVGTRDASQNMWKLSQVVEQLRASVEAFKLPDNSKISSRDLPQNSNGAQQRRPRLSRY
jgi:methyl-accepting chemotaxis protein